MKGASLKDKYGIVELLTAAFVENKSVNFLTGKDLRRIRGLMEYAFEVCFAFGKVFLTSDGLGCALVLFPDKKRFSFHSIRWDLKLVFSVCGIGHIVNVLGREKRMKAQHPAFPFYYLWFIGVDPAHAGAGIGSGLMRELILDAEAMGRPVYLETSTLKNIAWYERFGFNVFHVIDLGYPLFFLKQDTV